MNRKDQGALDAALAVLFLVFVACVLVTVAGGLVGVLGRSMGWW